MDSLVMQDVVVHDKMFTPMISADEIHRAILSMAKEITDAFHDKDPLCVSILNGAFVFAADLVRALHFDPEISFLKLRSYMDMHSTGSVSEFAGIDIEPAGRHVLVIEDIVDTGHTIAYLEKKLHDMGALSVTYVALLMKTEAYKYDIPIRFVGIEIPNRFVVGYGLDYNGHGRSLEHIYVLKEDS